MNDTKECSDVLIVEDNASDAELVIRSLKRHHLTNTILHVKDGQEALDYLLGEGVFLGRDPDRQPKIVLLDIKLPKLNGLETLSRMRADPRTRLTPVVVLTSSQEESDLLRSYHLGANSYIVKPVEFENFSKAILEIGLYWLLLNKPPPKHPDAITRS